MFVMYDYFGWNNCRLYDVLWRAASLVSQATVHFPGGMAATFSNDVFITFVILEKLSNIFYILNRIVLSCAHIG